MCPCRLIETTHCHTVSITLENCKLLLCLHNGSKVALWVLARCFHRPRLCKSSAALWTRRSCHHWENSQILMTPLLFYHQGLHYHCRKFNTSCKGIFKHIRLSQFLEKKKKKNNIGKATSRSGRKQSHCSGFRFPMSWKDQHSTLNFVVLPSYKLVKISFSRQSNTYRFKSCSIILCLPWNRKQQAPEHPPPFYYPQVFLSKFDFFWYLTFYFQKYPYPGCFFKVSIRHLFLGGKIFLNCGKKWDLSL